MKNIKLGIILFSISHLTCLNIYATTADQYRLLSGNSQSLSTSEYYFRKNSGKILIPVRLIGAVSKPGIYHLPENTNLTTLLSLSGGPVSNAELDEIKIKRSGTEIKNVDLEEILMTQENIPLKNGDTVFIPYYRPTISSGTVTVLTLIATFLSLGATIYVATSR
ncbi:MAG: hypothetical protein CL678_08835 [Bdellovibrionaceae bacterium]|nr:hypothetical protein [Pseudobdellovibrionaceae bacterium]|tara:strand:- start:672 stop:1166 length:495 start_codon:yes stop_codon:yes gene_type:complete